MNSIKESLKNWFGYTRRERRATFILLLIILTILGLRSVVPDQNINVTEIPIAISGSGKDSNIISGPKESERSGVKEFKNQTQRKLLDINLCDTAALEALPGLGPVLSARIIKFRVLIGGFVSINQLKEVYGLSEETYQLISSRFTIDLASIRKISINKADYRMLARHPYFQKTEVTAILKYRELKGRITGINEMIENNLISAATAGKIGPYLEFGD